jgi:hypothetical protein
MLLPYHNYSHGCSPAPALLQLQARGQTFNLRLCVAQPALHQPQLGVSTCQLPLQLLTPTLKHQPHLTAAANRLYCQQNDAATAASGAQHALYEL